jgi:hypothetical protein
MKLEHYNDYLTIEKDAIAWRYMNFSKIYELLSKNQIFFARLDSFNDPLEGMPLQYKLQIHLKNISKTEREDDPLKQLMAINPSRFKLTKSQIDAWQQGVFASCWYLTENTDLNVIQKFNNHHESLAMWGLFGDTYSFLLKIEFSSLLKLISESLEDFSDPEISEAMYGKIEYLTLYADSQRNFPKTPHRSLIKDLSYRHENELRFMLMRKNLIDETNNRKGITLNLRNKITEITPKIDVLCHPNMDFEVYKTFKPKFEALGVKMIYSQLITKEIINSFIQE